MFGYVKPHNPELLVKEYELYRAIYCGVCRAMRKYTGSLSSLGLSYDIVFLAVVRGVLSDEVISTKAKNCIVHPLKKRNTAEENGSIIYAARVSALLAYWKLKDDMADEGLASKIKGVFPLLVMKRAAKKAALPELNADIRSCMKELAKRERAKDGAIDECADVFGRLLSFVFSFGLRDEKKELACELGMRLGRFIYIVDAADDYEKDVKKGRYNPYAYIYGKDGLSDEEKAEINLCLRLELSSVTAAADALPYENHIPEENIIKNTVYLGLPKVLPYER